MTCPSEETFALFVTGELDEREQERLEGHLDRCPTCRVLVAALARGSADPTPSDSSSPLLQRPPFDRYVILEEVGAGSIGLVYAAHDQRLDRRVALKVLRPELSEDLAWRARLEREAQTMARLSHPGVVTVHDVGVVGEQVFIAMEYVEGRTVRQWLSETERSVGEILEIFARAGSGLAAAHQAGLVHRDFKPDNVLVGDDGRVCVTDFGLARSLAHAGPDAGVGGSEHQTPVVAVTRTGTLVGTPAYMAPEQLEGRPADPRSDQFGYCVALYEALCGERPFDGRTVDELLGSIRGARTELRGTLRLSSRTQRALRRGLAAAPEDRFASMTDLLTELRPPAVGQRRRSVVAASLAALLAVAVPTGIYLIHRSQLCSGADEYLEQVWSPARAATIRQAFAGTGLSYAADAWDAADRLIEEYGRAWVAMRTTSCEATRLHGEQSEAALDLRNACLDRRLHSLDRLLRQLTDPDPVVVQNALRAAGGLPNLVACADLRALGAPVELPTDPTKRREAEALREELDELETLRKTGRYEKGVRAARATLKRAEALGHRPLHAEALFHLGDLLALDAQLEPAVATLREAVLTADAARHDLVRARASLRLLWLVGLQMSRDDEVETLRASTRAAVERLAGQDLLRASWLRTEGELATHRGDLKEARAKLKEAEALVAGARHGDAAERRAEIVASLSGVAWEEGELDQAEAYLMHELELRRSFQGRHHPQVAAATAHLAMMLSGRSRFVAAEQQFRESLSLSIALLGEEHPSVATVRGGLGEMLALVGRVEEALPLLQAALETDERTYGRIHPNVALDLLVIGRAHAIAGRIAQGLDRMHQALAILEEVHGPNHIALTVALSQIGYALLDIGRGVEAEKYLSRVVELERKLGPDNLRVGETHAAIGDVLLDKAHYAKALKHYQAAERIMTALVGSKDPMLGWPLGGIGAVHLAQGRVDAALAEFERCQALDYEPGDDPNRVVALQNLGVTFLALGQNDKAVQLINEARTLMEGIFGRDHVQVGPTLAALADALTEQGHPDRGVLLARRALNMARAQLGPGHIDTEEATCVLGWALGRLHDPAAVETLQQCIELVDARAGAADPFRSYNLTRLGDALLARDEPLAALPVLERANALYAEHGVGTPADRAATAFSLAQALDAAGQSPKRAARLAHRALARYRVAGAGWKAQAETVEAWIADHGSSL